MQRISLKEEQKKAKDSSVISQNSSKASKYAFLSLMPINGTSQSVDICNISSILSIIAKAMIQITLDMKHSELLFPSIF